MAIWFQWKSSRGCKQFQKPTDRITLMQSGLQDCDRAINFAMLLDAIQRSRDDISDDALPCLFA